MVQLQLGVFVEEARVCHRTEVPVLSGMGREKRGGSQQPLSPHSSPPPGALGECAPATTSTDASRLSTCKGGAETTAET